MIIIHPDVKITKTNKKYLENIGHFISFGEDHEVVKEFENNFNGGMKRIDISEELEAIFPRIAKKFSDEVAELASRYSNLTCWWLSPFTEKNGWPSEHIVAEIIIEWIKQNNKFENLIFLTSNPFFGLYLKKELPGFNIKVIGKFKYLSLFLKKYFNAAKEIYRFLRQYVKKRYFVKKLKIVKYLRNTALSEKIVILRVYVHNDRFLEDGSFFDAHFGNTKDLKEFIESNGYNVIYEPNLSSVRQIEEFYGWMTTKAKDRFFLPEAFMSLKFLFASLNASLSHFMLYHRLGLRVNLQAKSFYLYDVACNFWKSQLPVVLHKQKITPAIVIFNWENKGYEKHMQLLFKKLLPNVIIKGYASSSLSPVLPDALSYSREIAITPKPNEIICASKYNYDILLSLGFPKDLLKVGPSLRDLYVFSEKTKIIKTNKDYCNTILICLPYNASLSSEIIEVILDYINGNDKYKIILKPHPFFSMENFKNYFQTDSVKDKIRISTKPMSEEAANALYFIYSGPTTTSNEAAALGKKVIRFVSKNYFSFGSLYYDKDENLLKFSTADDLAKILEDNRSKESDYINEEKKYYYFQPLLSDKSNLDVFIQT